MPISNVALTNTFDEWRVTTNQLIVVTNDLLGDGLTTYRSVTANVITANSLFFGTLNVVSTLTAAYDKANAANIIASSSYDKANAANVIATASFARANAANLIANLAFDQANTSISSAVLKTGNTMTGPLVAPTVNVTTLLRVTGNVDTASGNVRTQTLTDAATISWDGSLGQIATVTLGGARVLDNVTNLRVGTYILHAVQNSSGGSTLTFSNQYKFTSNIRPFLTSNANARDMFSFVSDGTNLYGAMIPDVG